MVVCLMLVVFFNAYVIMVELSGASLEALKSQ